MPFKDKEKKAAYGAAYREANKEKIAAYAAANKEKMAVYRAANKEKKAVYRAANKEKTAAYNVAYYAANKEKMAVYRAANYKSSSIGARRAGDSGYAGELIVRTDLLLRGLDVTVPENRCCPDDVHFLSPSADKWISVQVKVATVNKNTGYWHMRVRRGKAVTSDVIAWVNLHDRTIRYRASAKEIPRELWNSVAPQGRTCL